MSKQQLTRIAIGLAALIVVWGALKLLQRSSDTTTAKFALPALTPDDVDTIRIYQPSDTLVLTGQGASKWSVNGHVASTTGVNDLFSAMKGITRAELVAGSATSHKDLGVDSASGKRLVISKGGKTLVDLIVGGHGPAFRGVYVRRPGQDAVYLLEGTLGNSVDKGLDDWRDRTIAKIEPDSVREITVTLRRGGYALRHGANGWQFTTGAAADSGAVRRMLEQYRNFSAGGFPTPAQEDSLSFSRPTRRVAFRGAVGPLADLLFDSTASWWWVRRADGGPVYRLETWRLPQLFPADSTLKAKPAAKPATAKAPATGPSTRKP